jgi:hypothetical protein
MFSERKEGRKSFTAENAAQTLAGYGNFSLSSAFFGALKRGVRMIVFLILPAIARGNPSFTKAIKKGLGVFKVHLSEFVSGFVLTWLAAGIISLPAAILFYISDNFEVTFPTWVWVITIIYTGFAWSFYIYLEQMFAAGLYLWHLKWEKQIEEEKKLGKPLLNLRDIKRPSLVDEVPELLEK